MRAVRQKIAALTSGLSCHDPRRNQSACPDLFPHIINRDSSASAVRSISIQALLMDRYTHVVFHCSSSRGRGPRCAAWYADALEANGLPVNAYVLSGGIKAWMSKYAQDSVAVSVEEPEAS